MASLDAFCIVGFVQVHMPFLGKTSDTLEVQFRCVQFLTGALIYVQLCNAPSSVLINISNYSKRAKIQAFN